MPYENISKWTRPDSYMGATWKDWYSAGVGQSRDSDALERANFAAMLKALERLPEVEVMVPSNRYDDSMIEGTGLVVVRESHWAVGWLEWIAIHESNVAALELADKIMAKVTDYPVIDEELWSEYEDEDYRQTWENCYSESERAEYLRKHVSRVYPFPGETAYRMLRRAVKGDWSYAANLLPCPSDLIA